MLGSINRYYSVIRGIYELRKNQYRYREELERLQEKKLKKLITHAYNNVPLYNAKFKSADIKPTDIKGLKDLSKIPLMDKEKIRNSLLKDTLSYETNLKNYRIYITSGSTGIPLKVYRTRNDWIYYISRYYHILFESGVKLRDRMILLHVPRAKEEKHWFNKLGFLKLDSISIKQPIQNIVEKLLELKPTIMRGFPSIHLLLTHYMDYNIFNPKIILCSGETLRKEARKRIENFFNTALFSNYSSVETGRLAFECKQHDGLHIISDHHIIEFLKDGEHVSPGERGEIVVTSLHNYAMPFIRYRLGDFGVPSDELCSCGRTHPLIKKIEGREDDFLTLPSGRIISPRNINLNYIESIDGIAEFQIIQTRKDKFTVNLIKGSNFSIDTIKEIEKTIKSGCLGEEVDVEAKIVDKIARGRTGKLFKIISKV